MIIFPIERLNDLVNTYSDTEIKEYIRIGILTCIHSNNIHMKDCLYVIDTCILKPVALVEFYEREITLFNFYGSHIYIEDDEIDRTLELTDYNMVIFDDEGKPSKWFKDWPEELHKKYFKYIKQLINNYNIEYKLNNMISVDDIDEEYAHISYRDRLCNMLEEMVNISDVIDKVTYKLESNYPIELAYSWSNT